MKLPIFHGEEIFSAGRKHVTKRVNTLHGSAVFDEASMDLRISIGMREPVKNVKTANDA